MVAGVLTREILSNGVRVGFTVEDLAVSGEVGVLAHRESSSPVRVGRYGVDVGAFVRVGLSALRSALVGVADLVVIDEIARMAMACPGFIDAVTEVFSGATPVVATIQERSDAFTDALKARSDVETVEVTETTRDDLPGKLLSRLSCR
jgi:nucleoside-triphosphatase